MKLLLLAVCGCFWSLSLSSTNGFTSSTKLQRRQQQQLTNNNGCISSSHPATLLLALSSKMTTPIEEEEDVKDTTRREIFRRGPLVVASSFAAMILLLNNPRPVNAASVAEDIQLIQDTATQLQSLCDNQQQIDEFYAGVLAQAAAAVVVAVDKDEQDGEKNKTTTTTETAPTTPPRIYPKLPGQISFRIFQGLVSSKKVVLKDVPESDFVANDDFIGIAAEYSEHAGAGRDFYKLALLGRTGENGSNDVVFFYAKKIDRRIKGSIEMFTNVSSICICYQIVQHIYQVRSMKRV